MNELNTYPSLYTELPRRGKTIYSLTFIEVTLAVYLLISGAVAACTRYEAGTTTNCIGQAIGEMCHSAAPVVCTLTAALLLAMANGIYRGKNWSRILTALMCLPVLLIALLIFTGIEGQPGKLCSGAAVGVAAAYFGLLLRPGMSRWFR